MDQITTLWRYRFLAAMLVWKAVLSKYNRTWLGPLWVIVQPLGATFCASIFFRYFFHGTSSHPYWMQTAAAMTVWTFFSSIVDRAGSSLIAQEDLITKVYFPRVLLPLCASIAFLLDLCIVATITTLLVTQGHPGLSVLLLPAFYLPVFLLATSLGLALSSSMIFVRDVRLILPFLLQLCLYLSPILFPLSALPPNLQDIIRWNPLAIAITGVQACLGLGAFPSTLAYTYSLVLGTILLIFSYIYFSWLERAFADQI